MVTGTGPDWTPGERVRHLRTGHTGTVATVVRDRIVIRWDDDARSAYNDAMAVENLSPLRGEA